MPKAAEQEALETDKRGAEANDDLLVIIDGFLGTTPPMKLRLIKEMRKRFPMSLILTKEIVSLMVDGYKARQKGAHMSPMLDLPECSGLDEAERS